MKQQLLIASLCMSLFLSCSKNNDSDPVVPVPAVPTKIFYSGTVNDGSGIGWEEIFSCNIDGSNQQQLTNFSNNHTVAIRSVHPHLSYDSTALFFLSNRDNPGGSDLFKMKLDGTGIVKISTTPVANSNLSDDILLFQNDQKRVYTVNAYSEIWVSNIDGSNPQPLTNAAIDGYASNPTIDRVHNKIIYVGQVLSDPNQIFSMNFDGTEKRFVTTGIHSFIRKVKVSPDGTKVLMKMTQPIDPNTTRTDLYLTNYGYSTYSNYVQITAVFNLSPPGNSAIGDFDFASDGKIIYSIEEANPHLSQLHVMDKDGFNKRQLTTGTDYKSDAVIK